MTPPEKHIKRIFEAIMSEDLNVSDIEKRFKLSPWQATRCARFLRDVGLTRWDRRMAANGRQGYWALAVSRQEAQLALPGVQALYRKHYGETRSDFGVRVRTEKSANAAMRQAEIDAEDMPQRRFLKAGDVPPPQTTAPRSVFELA